jgi:hypothetical protein
MAQPISALFNNHAKLVSNKEWLELYGKMVSERLSFGEKLLLYAVERPVSMVASFMSLSRKIIDKAQIEAYEDQSGQLYMTGRELAGQAAHDLKSSFTPGLTRKCWEMGAEAFNAAPDHAARRRFMKPLV